MRAAKLSTARTILVFMAAASDHITGLAGATLTITSSKAGAAFASITPTVIDRGSGWYSVALTAGMLDTLGDFALHITAASADPSDLLFEVVAYDPADATALGLSRLDAAISTRSTLAAGAQMALIDDAITAAKIAAGAIGSSEAPALANLDASISSRLAAAGYTAPANADVAAIKAKTDNLPADPADESSLQAAIATRAAPGDEMALTTVEEDALVNKVWDEPLTGLTHNIATSAGRRVRELADAIVIISGTLQGATSNSVTFPATFPAVDGYYDHLLLVISSGTGAGQARPLQNYIGSSKVAEVHPDWATIPTGADFELYAFGEVHVHEVHEGAISAESFTPGAIDATAAPALDAAISSRAAAGDAMGLTAGAVDAILDDVVEGALTLRNVLRVMLAGIAGKASGAPDGPIHYRDQADTKDRIVGTIDGDGNRTAVVIDGN